MAKVTDIKEDKHIHNWYTVDGVEYHCKAYYKGYPCLKIKVGIEEYQRRIDEWTNFYQLCQQTEAKRDYDEMREAVKYGRKKEIRERIAKKMTVKQNDLGDNIYIQPNENYLESPDFPDPSNPNSSYVWKEVY